MKNYIKNRKILLKELIKKYHSDIDKYRLGEIEGVENFLNKQQELPEDIKKANNKIMNRVFKESGEKMLEAIMKYNPDKDKPEPIDEIPLNIVYGWNWDRLSRFEQIIVDNQEEITKKTNEIIKSFNWILENK